MTDTGQETAAEVEAVKMELGGLRQERETLLREVATGKNTVQALEQTLAERESEITALKQSLEDGEKRLLEVNETLAQAVANYRALVVEQNPGVLAELISGGSIAEVNEALRNARALVTRVKQEVEAEAAQTRVPFGAPQRAALDLSALSSREKIQYGIGGKR